MKIRNIQPIPSASDRIIQSASVPLSPWNEKDDCSIQMERKSQAFQAARRKLAKRKNPTVTVIKPLGLYQSTIMESSPRHLLVIADGQEFKIVKHSSFRSIKAIKQWIENHCGTVAAELFQDETFAFIPVTWYVKSTSTAWEVPASGNDCKRGEHTPSRKRFITSKSDLVRIAQGEHLANCKAAKWEKEHQEA